MTWARLLPHMMITFPRRRRVTARLLRAAGMVMWLLAAPLLALATGCMVLAGRLAGWAHDLGERP